MDKMLVPVHCRQQEQTDILESGADNTRQGEISQFMEETLKHIATVGPLESEVAMEKKEEQLPYMVEL